MLTEGCCILGIARSLCTVQHGLSGRQSVAMIIHLSIRAGHRGVWIQGVVHYVILTWPFEGEDEIESRPAITLETLSAAYTQVWL